MQSLRFFLFLLAAAPLFLGIPREASAMQVPWSAGMERGNLTEWSDHGGGEHNFGTGDSEVSQDIARSGASSVKMTITPGNNGTMMYPWLEAAGRPSLNYTVWYYFPQRYSVPLWWNIMQWGSRSPTLGARPFQILHVGNRLDGSMFLYLFDWQTGQSYSQTLRDIPVGQWFRVDASYHCAADGSGSITLWQDGVQLFDVANLQTRYHDGDCAWSVNNYSDNVASSPTTIYVDDVSISAAAPAASGSLPPSSTATSTNPTNPTTSPNVIWSANHETGDDSQWSGNYGGGQFNSGIGRSVASREQAHSGSWGLKMTITTPPESGTRLFRWEEPRQFPRLRYSTWLYFPQRYTVANYWNVVQWKSRRAGAVDPFFVLNIGNRPDGSMYFYLYNWQSRQVYSQSVKNIPVGQWVKIDAYHHCSGSSGHVAFWQDGTLLFDVPNVQTGYSDNNCEWSVDNYSNGLSPSPATIYMDDASITPE